MKSKPIKTKYEAMIHENSLQTTEEEKLQNIIRLKKCHFHREKKKNEKT